MEPFLEFDLTDPLDVNMAANNLHNQKPLLHTMMSRLEVMCLNACID